MACKPEWSDSTEDSMRDSQINQLKIHNKILKTAIEQIYRIAHPHGGPKQIARDALLDIGEDLDETV